MTRRVFLIHWRPGEAADKVAQLESGGHSVACGAPEGSAGLAPLRKDPPLAIVIDLDRAPARGREMGLALRQYKDTRTVPLVFAGGAKEKVDVARSALPDAAYCSWESLPGSLGKAIADAPAEPFVPPSVMAGYSGRPLAGKLGIKDGFVVGLVNAPEDFEATLGALPSGVSIRRQPRSVCDLLIWFTVSRRELERRVVALGKRSGAGGLWIAWPKKASGVKTDVTQTLVRSTGLAVGLVDYKICAIDATWSGLRFAWRKKK